jgi:hypothetical protein
MLSGSSLARDDDDQEYLTVLFPITIGFAGATPRTTLPALICVRIGCGYSAFDEFPPSRISLDTLPW